MVFARLLLFCFLASSAYAQGESARPHPGEDRFFTIVLRADERAKYEFLTEKEKGTFQRIHWGRLDPSPATEENEREAEHQRRVVDAIDKFQDRFGRFMWDDRARAWIRFGAPLGAESVRGGIAGGRLAPPREIWLYADMLLWFEDRTLTGSFSFGKSEGTAPVPEEAARQLGTGEGFVRDRIGEEDPDAGLARALASLSVDPERAAAMTRAGNERWETVPEQNEQEAPATGLPFVHDVCAFGRGDGLTDLVVGVEIPSGSLARTIEIDGGGSTSLRVEIRTALRDSVFATLWRDRKSLVRRVGPGESADPWLVSVDSFAVKPGTYQMVLQVEDLVSGQGGAAAAALLVPSFSGDSVLLSELLFAEKASASFREQGALLRGEYRIDPRPSRVFRRGEQAHVYFEVVHLCPDRDGRFYYEVAYALSGTKPGDFSTRFRGTEKGRLAPGRIETCRSISRESSSAHSIAIDGSGLPPDAYTLTVEVKDFATGGTARALGRFTVEE